MENADQPSPVLKPGQIFKYNTVWDANDDLDIEMAAIRLGGKWKNSKGEDCGEGLESHHRALDKLLWPHDKWHKWSDLLNKSYCENRVVAVLGPASSAKTHDAAKWALRNYFCFSEEITILISSTDSRGLELRIWGEIKKYFSAAKARYGFLPGNITESRTMISTDGKDSDARVLDRRNGIVGVPCFPFGTPVDTIDGSVNIENLKVGDIVYNAGGCGRISAISETIAPRLMRFTLEDGRVVDGTEEHPILTQDGWKKMCDMEINDMVFSRHETLHLMWGRHHEPVPEQEILPDLQPLFPSPSMRPVRDYISPWPQSLWKKSHTPVLFHDLRGSFCGRPRDDSFGNKTLSDMRQVNGEGAFLEEILLGAVSQQSGNGTLQAMRQTVSLNSRISKQAEKAFLQSVLRSEGAYAEAFSVCQNAGGNFDFGDVSELGVELFTEDRAEGYTWKKPLVQAGCCLSRDQARRGNRWWHSSDSVKGRERQKTGHDSFGTRVVRVEVLKSSGDFRYSHSESGYPVRNLEVEGHPSYSVNGVIVHNCVVNHHYVGLGRFAGVKNKRVLLIADELQFMYGTFIEAIANLDSNLHFQCIGMGNPKEQTDALGRLAEPSEKDGGWEGRDKSPRTKTWRTRFMDGICVQLYGTDSPNFDVPEDQPPPFPFLITRKKIQNVIEFYGKDSMQFWMQCIGDMPDNAIARRVLTRQMAIKFKALEEVVWSGQKRTKIYAVDAAYGSIGGDRCVGGELNFGTDIEGNQILAYIGSPVIIPVSVANKDMPEDQIAKFVKADCERRDIPPEHVFYDATGRGSLGTAFARCWSSQINPIEFGGAASDRPVSADIRTLCRDYYSKFVTELWFTVRHIIESGQFRQMPEEVLAEGCMREWKMVNRNRIEIEVKEEMKIRMGRSPDLFDQLATGCEGARRLGFVIKRLGDVYRKESKQWLHDLRKQSLDLKNHRQLVYSR